VIVAGGEGYDAARQSFNAMLDRYPAIVTQPVDAADVAVALRIAREHRLPIGIRGGRHSVAGYGLVDGGLVIDLRNLRTVTVDAGRHRASAGGGATWADLDTPAQEHDLAVTGGTFVDTGIAGLTLGGGIGYLIGLCGFTCDNLVGAQVITSEGRTLEVTVERDAELMWALRGGGGNFGAVTRFDYRLFDVGAMYGGETVVPLGEGAVLRRYAEMQVWAPDELSAALYIAHDAELGPVLAIDLAWLGPQAQGERFGKAIIGPSRIVDGGFTAMRYGDIQSLGQMPFTYRHYWKSTFVGDLTPDVVTTIVEHVKRRPAGKSGVLIEPIHGQARRYGFEHACFPQRTARFHVSALGIWEDPAKDEVEIAWVRDLHAALAKLGVGGTYVNYVAPDEPADRARSIYPAAVYERLQRIKRRVDPDNVFRSNVNIPPA
jgi:FAD/FMN-containing dehydrogenase